MAVKNANIYIENILSSNMGYQPGVNISISGIGLYPKLYSAIGGRTKNRETRDHVVRFWLTVFIDYKLIEKCL